MGMPGEDVWALLPKVVLRGVGGALRKLNILSLKNCQVAFAPVRD